MAKNQWRSGVGVIVDVESAFGYRENKYTIEIRKSDGPLIRRVVKYKMFPPYEVGTRVKIQISGDNQIRFNPDTPGEAAIVSTMDLSEQIAEASRAFGQVSAEPGGDEVSFVITTSTGMSVKFGEGSGIATALTAVASTPGAMLQMVGPTGIEVNIDPAEIKNLARAVSSADPDERKAAFDRYHQLRAAALGQSEPRG